ncbi:MAG: [protein-PII] uridylyltransferase [Caulobacterales bacterium]|jgi:[protein-PII] uridylyltransferase
MISPLPKRRLPPARIEQVVDGAKLRVQLSACAQDGIGDEASVREQAKKLIHGALFRGRMIAKERLEDGDNGLAVARLLARVMDEAIAALYDFTATHVFRSRNPTEGERMSVIAVGGYGRGELAPSSDIDLLFVRNYKLTPWAESVTEYMLYMLWDMGLKVGHASRSIDECVKLAREDHTIETALLEQRRIAGDQALADELRVRFQNEVVAGRHAAFIAAKLAERDRRHERAGASRYMVEPNIKEGKGGLRDLHTLFWLVLHRYGPRSPGEYIRDKIFTLEEAARFRRAMQFFWTVRCHLHFLTGRSEERLSFDVQPELAARMGFGARAGQQAVERFMKRYFLEAKEVGALTRAICAKLEEDEAKSAPRGLSRFFASKKVGVPVEEAPGFLSRGGRLELDDPSLLDQPLNLLRLFYAADVNKLDIHPTLLREAQMRVRKITPNVRRLPEAQKLFLEVAASRRSPGRILRLMNEVGVLGRFLPEFGRIVAQMQFNMYHHYTVDEHTLRAVEIISDIELGRYKAEHPLATAIFPKIINRRALYLAMLLHDTGKGIGDQQEEGAKVAALACERLGLSNDEVELVAWLVGNHLAMSDVAQKRDIGDPRTVAQFANLTGNVERLRLLLVLTIADMRAVGPGVWNGWKAQLLRDLYRLTEATFHGGRTDEAAVRERLRAQADEARAALAASLSGKTRKTLQDWIAGLDDAYWLSFDMDALSWHAAEAAVAAQTPEGVHVAARPRADIGKTELLVIAPDRPGLFASLAAACATAGADIADARIHTAAGGLAFDVFSVQTIEGHPYGVDDSEALASLMSRMSKAALRDHAPPPRRAASRRAAAFAIAPWVRFDNELAGHATVLEVSGRDRPGLLAELAHVLAESDIHILSAHIGSYGERVADVFYMSRAKGDKLTDGRKLNSLRNKLVKVLAADEPAAPADPAKQPMAVARASTAR